MLNQLTNSIDDHIRGPYIWNEFLSNKEKEIELTSSFKSTIKSKLLSLNNEISYF